MSLKESSTARTNSFGNCEKVSFEVRRHAEIKERALTELIKRKTRSILQRVYLVRGRPMVAQVEASGLRLREIGRQSTLEIIWPPIFNRAAEIAAERSRRNPR